MGFPTVAGRNNSQTAANATAHTVAFDTTPTTGDLLIVVACWDGDPTITWPTSEGTWTVINTTTSGTGVTMTARYKVAAGEGSSIALTSSASEEMQARAWRIAAGTYTGNPVNGTAVASSGDNNPNPPNCAFAATDDHFVIAVFAQDNGDGTVSAYPTDFTDGQSGTGSGGSGGVSQGAADRQFTGASLNPGTFTSSLNGRWVAQTIAVRGVAAPAGIVPPVHSMLHLLVR